MIEFNKGHYGDLWQRKEFYTKKLGSPSNNYDLYINMIGHILASVDSSKTKFPHTVQVKQELIKIIMLAQADAVKGKLDVSSLKPPRKRTGIIKRIFRKTNEQSSQGK